MPRPPRLTALSISLLYVCLYVCLCVHETAEPLDGVHELPDTQTAQQTDVNETYCVQFNVMCKCHAIGSIKGCVKRHPADGRGVPTTSKKYLSQ